MVELEIHEVPTALSPFSQTGIFYDEHGIPLYEALPTSLLEMLENHVTDRPEAEAVVELGGQRLTYRQLWDRAARAAGGLRTAGPAAGARGGPPPSDWSQLGSGVLGHPHGGWHPGGDQHPLGRPRGSVRRRGQR